MKWHRLRCSEFSQTTLSSAPTWEYLREGSIRFDIERENRGDWVAWFTIEHRVNPKIIERGSLRSCIEKCKKVAIELAMREIA